jgi:hypothetical protein
VSARSSRARRPKDNDAWPKKGQGLTPFLPPKAASKPSRQKQIPSSHPGIIHLPGLWKARGIFRRHRQYHEEKKDYNTYREHCQGYQKL